MHFALGIRLASREGGRWCAGKLDMPKGGGALCFRHKTEALREYPGLCREAKYA